MITNEGKNHIKRYLAGYVPAIAQSMSLGIGSRAEAGTDMALHMEVSKTPIGLVSYDFVNNDIVYKASIDDAFVGKIYEVGIYSLQADPTAGDFASRLITTFDSFSEKWSDSTGADAPFTSVNTRVGLDSLSFTPAASATTTYFLNEISLDLSGYSSADTFNFAFNAANSNASAVRVRMLTDGTNFYDFNLGAQTAGYKIIEVTKAGATVTGTPSWNNITSIQITVISGTGGASSIEFEAIRVEDKDSSNSDYVLVARKVLTTPVTKSAGMPQDIEFTLDVTL